MAKRFGVLNRMRAGLIARKPARRQLTFWVEMFKKTPEAKEMISAHRSLLKSGADPGDLKIDSVIITGDYLYEFRRFAIKNDAPLAVLNLIEKSIKDIEG